METAAEYKEVKKKRCAITVLVCYCSRSGWGSPGARVFMENENKEDKPRVMPANTPLTGSAAPKKGAPRETYDSMYWSNHSVNIKNQCNSNVWRVCVCVQLDTVQ